MIASIVEKARTADPPIPTMVVTGDRDAYQLVDDGVVKIMTTSRGITDTRVYDREGVIDRYGIPPELIPDFIGLKGDTSDNIPGVPGIGDKTAAELLQRFGTLEERPRPHRRHLRRQAQAEPDRARRRRATLQGARHRQAGHRRRARPPGVRGGRARPLAAEGHVPQVRAARAAAPARGGARLRRRRRACPAGRGRPDRSCPRRQPRRRSPRPRQAGVGGGETAAGSRRRRCSLLIPSGASASTSTARPRCSRATRRALNSSWRRSGAAPVTAHDAKSLGRVPAVLAHDTEVAAYLLEPARRAYPFRELTEERGLGTDVAGRGRRRRAAAARARRLAARGDPRARADRPVRECRAPARAGPPRDGAGRLQARHRAARARSPTGSRPRPTSSSARSSSCAARSSRSARPSSSRRSCSASSACRASGAARPATRPTRACSRRSGTSTR